MNLRDILFGATLALGVAGCGEKVSEGVGANTGVEYSSNSGSVSKGRPWTEEELFAVGSKGANSKTSKVEERGAVGEGAVEKVVPERVVVGGVIYERVEGPRAVIKVTRFGPGTNDIGYDSFLIDACSPEGGIPDGIVDFGAVKSKKTGDYEIRYYYSEGALKYVPEGFIVNKSTRIIHSERDQDLSNLLFKHKGARVVTRQELGLD